MFTFLSRVWRTFFCTIPEGACAIELEDFCRDACARRSRSAAQRDPTLSADFPAAVVVFLVALPLCLGIALGSSAPLFSGIIAGVVGGIVIGTLSGSSLSVSGPAAGLTAIVAVAIGKLPRPYDK